MASQPGVEPLDRRPHRGLEACVVPHLAIGGVEVVVAAEQAQAITVSDPAAETRRLHAEGASRIGDGGAIGADDWPCTHAQACPRCVGRSTIKRGQSGEFRVVCEQWTQIIGSGEFLVLGIQCRSGRCS